MCTGCQPGGLQRDAGLRIDDGRVGAQELVGVIELSVTVRVAVEGHTGDRTVAVGNSLRDQRGGRSGDDAIRRRRQRRDIRQSRPFLTQRQQRAQGVETSTGGNFSGQRGQRVGVLQDGVANLGDAGVGIDRPGQRCYARYVRRCHTRSRI